MSHMKADARFCSKTGADCDNAGEKSVNIGGTTGLPSHKNDSKIAKKKGKLPVGGMLPVAMKLQDNSYIEKGGESDVTSGKVSGSGMTSKKVNRSDVSQKMVSGLSVTTANSVGPDVKLKKVNGSDVIPEMLNVSSMTHKEVNGSDATKVLGTMILTEANETITPIKVNVSHETIEGSVKVTGSNVTRTSVDIPKNDNGSDVTLKSINGSVMTTEKVDKSGFTHEKVNGSCETPKKVKVSRGTPKKDKGSGGIPKKDKGSGRIPKKDKMSGKIPKKDKGSGKIPKKDKGSGKIPKKDKGSGGTPKNVTVSEGISEKVNGSVEIPQKIDGSNMTSKEVNGSMGSPIQVKGNLKKGKKGSRKSNGIAAMADQFKFFKRGLRRKGRPKSHRRAFAGYCGCRDLGMFRICRKCKTKHKRKRTLIGDK